MVHRYLGVCLRDDCDTVRFSAPDHLNIGVASRLDKLLLAGGVVDVSPVCACFEIASRWL
jgi:hypothetical protein